MKKPRSKDQSPSLSEEPKEPTPVLKFGARPNDDKKLWNQMVLGRRYYNALAEAENARRRAAWGGDHPAAPPHEECVCTECKKKAKAKAKAKTEAEAKAKPEHEYCRCRKCKAHWRAIRKAVKKAPKIDLRAIRAAAVAGGLYWGTYLPIEQAFAAAVKKTSLLRTIRFRSWRQGDVAAVQIQLGHNPDLYFRVEPQNDPRTGRRAGRRHLVRIRIGSAPNKDPIFSDPIRIEMHRPIVGTVTWVHVRRKWNADRQKWSVAFTCKGVPEKPGRATTGVVAVDVSWRKLSTGQWRLAYAQDDAGNVDQLLMSPEWTERSDRADRIRSHRDDRMNALKEKDPRFALCKSCQGIVRKARAEGVLTQEMDDWVARELHLWRYECGCRRRSADARRAQLVAWVSALRDRYRFCVVKDTKHKRLKEEHGLPQKAARQGQHAAPGETVEVLRRMFGFDGMRIVKAPRTTSRCVDCGRTLKVNGELVVRCERCGASRDRDDASTRNMLRLHTAGKWTPPTARKTTPRFAKRHVKKEVQSECQLDG